MQAVWLNLRRSIFRVIPACLTQAQAVAFNMFLAFFPLLLLTLGILSGSSWMQGALEGRGIPSSMRVMLPPGSQHLVAEFLLRQQMHSWDLILVGLGGTLLVGTQVMTGLMEGFRIAWGGRARLGVVSRYSRALVLLCLTIAPWLAVVVLTVFGRQVRTRIIQQVGMPLLVRGVWTLLYYAGTLMVALLVLVVVYRVAKPWVRRWDEVIPGAIVATVLWWVLNAGFGFYVRNMPYGVVYGSLAAVIGLLVWMYFTALVLITGAAYNAELAAAARAAQQAPARQPAAESRVASSR